MFRYKSWLKRPHCRRFNKNILLAVSTVARKKVRAIKDLGLL